METETNQFTPELENLLKTIFPIEPTISSTSLDDTYYRSRIFTADTGNNPLLSAAAPILTLIPRLQRSEDFPNPQLLHEDLKHELHAFVCQANRECNSETVMIARYVLCATLDDIVKQTEWGKQGLWQHEKLLPLFHQQIDADDQFFNLIDRLSEMPKQNIHILELIYLCLSLGYLGKYQGEENSLQELNLAIDGLYQTIHRVKGDVHSGVLLAGKQFLADTEIKKFRSISHAWIISLVATLLLSLFLILNYMLTIPSDTSLQTLQLIQQQNQLQEL